MAKTKWGQARNGTWHIARSFGAADSMNTACGLDGLQHTSTKELPEKERPYGSACAICMYRGWRFK